MSRKLSPEKVRQNQVAEMRQSGMSNAEIATALDLSETTVRRIVRDISDIAARFELAAINNQRLA